jgi:hypothetical protein
MLTSPERKPLLRVVISVSVSRIPIFIFFPRRKTGLQHKCNRLKEQTNKNTQDHNTSSAVRFGILLFFFFFKVVLTFLFILSVCTNQIIKFIYKCFGVF